MGASCTQFRNFAARKGTRERRMKKLKKSKPAVVEKVGFIPHNQRDKERQLALRPKLKFDDSQKPDPLDDVYSMKYFRSKTYSFEEAVKCHRETHHPQIYNMPNSPLHVKIELNMLGEKKTRFVDNFTRMVAIPHTFEHGEERLIIAFAKDEKIQKETLENGAQLAGGVDLIKQIQSGAVNLQNFKFVLAHPDILPELVALRGLMKKKFPNPKTGTLDTDLASVTRKFVHGIYYGAVKNEYEKDYGLVETIIGTLDMPVGNLEENFGVLIKDLESMRPRRQGTFISRCLLWSPPSSEKFKVDHDIYLPGNKGDKGAPSVELDDGEEKGERVAL